MELLAYISYVILKALTDALFFKNNKKLSKVIENFSDIVIIFIPLLYRDNFDYKYLLDILIMYVCIRIALFDPLFNIFAGLNLKYTGTTTYKWDDMMSRLKDWKFWVFRGWFLFVSIFIWFLLIR